MYGGGVAGLGRGFAPMGCGGGMRTQGELIQMLNGWAAIGVNYQCRNGFNMVDYSEGWNPHDPRSDAHE